MAVIEEMNINGITLKPGDQEMIRLHVGKLPSGARIYINAHIFRSSAPGPTVLLLAGMHGDEINGVEILRKLVSNREFDHLIAGTVILIPLLNVFGFINFSRDVPDGKDVNRSFPGNMSGSLASRMARVLTKKVLPLVDFGVDFHTGGATRFNFPQIRYSKRDHFASELATQFSPPFIIEKGLIPRSLRKVSFDYGIPILIYEGGEAQRFDGLAIQKGIEGVKRLLYANGMLDATVTPTNKSILIKKTSWIRASIPGLFLWNKSSGQKILKNEPLGVIHDPYGTKKVSILSRRDGYLIGHNNASVVNQGDALFHVGFDSQEI